MVINKENTKMEEIDRMLNVGAIEPRTMIGLFPNYLHRKRMAQYVSVSITGD